MVFDHGGPQPTCIISGQQEHSLQGENLVSPPMVRSDQARAPQMEPEDPMDPRIPLVQSLRRFHVEIWWPTAILHFRQRLLRAEQDVVTSPDSDSAKWPVELTLFLCVSPRECNQACRWQWAARLQVIAATHQGSLNPRSAAPRRDKASLKPP
jgi:hypothetical protein